MVFIDNAETGLPMWAEILVKGIVEICVGGISVSFGLSKENPIIMIISIVLGLGFCLVCYWMATYIIWILLIVLLLAFVAIILFIIHKKKDKKEDVINGEMGI